VADFVDYYKLLEVARNATEDEINKQHIYLFRTWQSRQNLPTQELQREAEDMMRNLASAKNILLDKHKRKQFDRELANYERIPSEPLQHQPIPIPKTPEPIQPLPIPIRQPIKGIYKLFFVLGVIAAFLQIVDLSSSYYYDRFVIPDRIVSSEAGVRVVDEIKKLKKADPKTFRQLQTLVADNRALLEKPEDSTAIQRFGTELQSLLSKPQGKDLREAIKRMDAIQNSNPQGKPIAITAMNYALGKTLLTAIPKGKVIPDVSQRVGSTIDKLVKIHSQSQDRAVLWQNRTLIAAGEQLKQVSDTKQAYGIVQTAVIRMTIEEPNNELFKELANNVANVKNEEQVGKLVGSFKVLTDAAKSNPHNSL
jgi:curved DNA-binding protein CbpA